jgi:acyl transferase domain-containing protein/acyl carrier protein
MKTENGVEAFYRALAMPNDQVMVVEGILPKIANYYLQKREGVEAACHCREETNGAVDRSWAAETHISLDQVQRRVQRILATVLHTELEQIDVEQAFVELGLDSFLGTEMVNAINRAYGTELSNIAVFDYPNVKELARLVEQEMGKQPVARREEGVGAVVESFAVAKAGTGVREGREIGAVRATTLRQAERGVADKIAIIGMSGRYPQARNLQQYWENLAGGRNAIVEVPATRWDVNRYYDPEAGKKGKTNSKWLGAVEGIECFDPLFFHISPREAEYIDPHHRLFLQESYKAFEDAGYSGQSLGSKKCGVYLGISTNEYAVMLSQRGELGGAPVTSNHTAIAAARIAYYLNLKGPAIAVDTACSSSLVAIHLACQGLISGETEMALAGGVSVWLRPESYVAMSQAGMLSPEGQCKTFDDGADGIVVSDGVGVVVLKRLREAERDGDNIYGVILGSGVNQDGRTNGITAPSVQSQIELERSIYEKQGIDPGTISYVEAHGTGTRLGDPIELEALATVFQEKTKNKNFCGIGSVKSNIGHTTSAAGVAGLQKVLLSLQHGSLVPSLHVKKETTRFNFENSPFYVVKEKQEWAVEAGKLRRAAVSSFGFSGTNAHVVIEEYGGGKETPRREGGSYGIVLSARTREQLKEKAEELLEYVREERKREGGGEGIDLERMGYTLQVGREGMEERMGMVVSSVEELEEKLGRYVEGVEDKFADIYEGRVESKNTSMTIIGVDDDMQAAIDRWIARRKFPQLLDFWVRGLNLDWNKLYGSVKPRRMSLPTYPFAEEHCWIDRTFGSDDSDRDSKVDGNMKLIDDIFDKIADNIMETDQALTSLQTLV